MSAIHRAAKRRGQTIGCERHDPPCLCTPWAVRICEQCRLPITSGSLSAVGPCARCGEGD